MNSVLSVRSLTQMFGGKAQDIINEIDNVHMVWLEEIQQEANRMFSRDFNAEPELMPKTPSQKKNSRRKRVSLGRQEENQGKQRYSKGRRSNLRGSSVKSLQFIAKEDPISEVSTSEASSTGQSKRTTRRNKQTKPEVVDDESQSPHDSDKAEEVQNKKPMLEEEEVVVVMVDKNKEVNDAKVKPGDAVGNATPPESPKIPLPEAVVSISHADRLSAELAKEPEPSPGRTAAKIAIAEPAQTSRRSSAQCSLKLRHSLAGLRHSMTQESVRRASRRSMLKRKATRAGNSTCSTKVSDDSCVEEDEEEMEKENQEVVSEAVSVANAAPEKSQGTPEGVQQSLMRITRSVAANSPKLAPPSLFISEMKMSTPNRAIAIEKLNSLPVRRSSRSTKRKAPDTIDESPTKRCSPPKKSQSAIKPHMKSFLHTVQKNQMLMMTPNSVGRTAVIKSFIKHNTPLRIDPKFSTSIVTKERNKLEALKKKQEQEEERMRKMEEEKKRKQDELKRKRDERLRRVFEAKVKEEQREEEKKKKIEQKMAQIDEKNDKRLADEKAKKKAALKRQEELEQKRKMEEEAKKKKMQQEEEKRQQELLAKKKAEEEARKALELKREQERERERELERERQAAAERERVEKEKALALQREVERAAREKEMRELEEKRKALEEKRKLEEQQRLAAKEKAAKEMEAAKQRDTAAKTQTAANLNVTVDIERSVISTPVGKGGGLNVTVDIEHSSPQSYAITPKGGDKPLILSKNPEDYGMDQNSDDSTDDESAPRKPIPSWAEVVLETCPYSPVTTSGTRSMTWSLTTATTQLQQLNQCLFVFLFCLKFFKVK
ncbi:inner centromere protein A isoform X3 [Oreochromis niloticus]|uniref:inner centromere protein A isoform X3 n=1 Tax=Oreochromis niloticus TaxID=8128 RepID=UPI000674E416|nr:inner centromere protein isoform X3 [Oreochromis niloticus]